MPGRETPIDLSGALRHAYPELEDVTGGAGPVYLVGGAVRDLLLGRGRADIDLVVVGDPLELAATLGGAAVATTMFPEFGTAKVSFDGHEVDVAGARIETYPHPGALPVVKPAADIEADLARRDFTINAMAVLLGEHPELIDPWGGQADLADGLLRVLHEGSFADDPTRAIRAARYAARLDFDLEPATAELLATTDLSTVSTDRCDAELARLAAENSGLRGLGLLASWGLIEPRQGGIELAAKVVDLLGTDPWHEVDRPRAIIAAALDPLGEAAELAAAEPERPSQAVALVGGRGADELVLARALGAEWLDRYMAEWRHVSLEIDGADLLAVGVPEGPAVGRGLQAALRRKLDGEIGGRERELAAALEAAKER